MANINCLEGKKCPACGHEDELLVVAKQWVSLTDDGTDPFADSLDMKTEVDYNGDSPAECPVCGFAGKLGMWERTEGEGDPAPEGRDMLVRIYFESDAHAEFVGVLPDGVYTRIAPALDRAAEEMRMRVTTSACETPGDMRDLAAELTGRPADVVVSR